MSIYESHPPPIEDAPGTPDELALRDDLRDASASRPPSEMPPFQRLGWIYSQVWTVLLHYGWIYLMIVGYTAVAGLLWIIVTFFALLGAMYASIMALIASQDLLAGMIWIGFVLFMLLSLGMCVAGYFGGIIRMLTPVVYNRPANPMQFIAGATLLGPRLLGVFIAALLLASIPIWMLTGYLFDLLVTYGWSVLNSNWNRPLQLEILGVLASRMLGIAITLTTVNLLLGPWQVMVGTRRLNFLAALPLTIGYLFKNLPLAIPVIALNFIVQLGVTQLVATHPRPGLLLQLFVSPLMWMSLIALMAPESPEIVLAPPPTRRPPRSAIPAPAAHSAQASSQPPVDPDTDWKNPVPGLIPD